MSDRRTKLFAKGWAAGVASAAKALQYDPNVLASMTLEQIRDEEPKIAPRRSRGRWPR